jgi:hypothetical protein
LAVRVEADRDVALVARDLELVGDRRPLGRQAVPVRPGRLGLCRRELGPELPDELRLDRALVLLLAGRQRLALLRAVAVDRDGLQAELPALQVDLLAGAASVVRGPWNYG